MKYPLLLLAFAFCVGNLYSQKEQPTTDTKPFKWGFKFSYELPRSVPQYMYVNGKDKQSIHNMTFLNFGLAFQVYGKNQRNYHEIALSRLWHNESREGYRNANVIAFDTLPLQRTNNNFQIGLRYAYYLQPGQKKKDRKHKFFLEFPVEVFYHTNWADWDDTTRLFNQGSLLNQSESYVSNVIGFSAGVTAHYHCFITDRVYLDVAGALAYTGMVCFTDIYSSKGFNFEEKHSVGYFDNFSSGAIPYGFRFSLGVKLYKPEKRKKGK
jgi:hypothetical protein